MDKSNEKMIERAPVVVVMGHIDHGKSTLLDYIRKSNQVENETGGITQHISAYEVVHKSKSGKEKKITFLDTPGHEAFQKMRRRGAGVADVAILVVSADDGVKPQTLEAYKSIEESHIPYVVAITKIDKNGADIDRVKQSLAENNIFLEGYGGNISFVPVSSKTGEGIDELLEIILLTAELEELKADVGRNAEGVVIEADRDPKAGGAATLIIKDGTIKSGMFVVTDSGFAPTRIMEDYNGNKIKEASFSSPIRVVGFNELPIAGSSFQTVSSKKEAETLLEKMRSESKESTISSEDSEKEEEIPIVLKTDVAGSMDAVIHELKKLEGEKVSIKIVTKGTGEISENDLKIASGKPNTVVIGFNVKISPSAKDLALKFGLKIETFKIIYELASWFEKIVEERTPVSKVEEIHGKIKVLKFFSRLKNKQIIGARLLEGEISLGDKVKITRREIPVGEGKVVELQENKVSAERIHSENSEFGTRIDSSVEIAPGDIIEAYTVKLIK